jgi:hypothetical protein
VSALESTQVARVRDLALAYARHRPVRSVAALGNQPLAPDAERAAAVDSCDLVVRVNGFRPDDPGDPPTYGRRTDVVFFNRGLRGNRWFFKGYRDRLYLLVEPGRMHWEPAAMPTWWPDDLGQVHLSNADLTLPLSEDLGVDTRVESLWATTGTMAAWWARTTFPDAELHLAGYSFVTDPDQTRWDHAAGDDCDISPDHRIALEGNLMRRWADEGHARLWT